MTRQDEAKRTNIKHLLNLGPVFGYFFRGNDPTRKTNFNMRTMHTINKISMVMFLVGIIAFGIKLALR